jgi:hypothetical protein
LIVFSAVLAGSWVLVASYNITHVLPESDNCGLYILPAKACRLGGNTKTGCKGHSDEVRCCHDNRTQSRRVTHS